MRRAASIVAASFLACGARTELGTNGDASVAEPLVSGVVMKSCAPDDGPALVFSLGTPVPTCQIPGIAKGIILLIWSPLPTGPGTFVIGDGSVASGSSGYVCDAENTCSQATGTIVLTELTSTSASGTYTLSTLTRTVTASFEGVLVCPVSDICK